MDKLANVAFSLRTHNDVEGERPRARKRRNSINGMPQEERELSPVVGHKRPREESPLEVRRLFFWNLYEALTSY